MTISKPRMSQFMVPLELLLEEKSLSMKARYVYVHLLLMMQEYRRLDINEIVSSVPECRRTVMRAVRELEAANYISIVK